MLEFAIRRLIPALMTLVILAGCGASAPETGQGSASSAASTAATASEAPAASAATDSMAAASVPAASPAASGAATTQTTEASSEATTATTGGDLTVYSGRNEELVGELLKEFESSTGTKVNVKYGDSAELAATILEEGANSPADVFFSQDAGALGALAKEDRLQKLPDDVLNQVDAGLRSPEGEWVGVSGRARVVVFNTQTLTETDLPETIFGFTDPKWKGKLGWVPTNASFQSFVTALRVIEGEDRAREWLQGIQANEPKVYENNSAVVKAAAAGEIDAGFVNHYYLIRQLQEQGQGFAARNYFPKNGDPGALINVAGAAVLNGSKNQQAAEQFVNFLLSKDSQQYFADKTFEYPLAAGVQPNAALPALSEIQTPKIDLSKLEDLQGTLQLLTDLGIL